MKEGKCLHKPKSSFCFYYVCLRATGKANIAVQHYHLWGWGENIPDDPNCHCHLPSEAFPSQPTTTLTPGLTFAIHPLWFIVFLNTHDGINLFYILFIYLVDFLPSSLECMFHQRRNIYLFHPVLYLQPLEKCSINIWLSDWDYAKNLLRWDTKLAYRKCSVIGGSYCSTFCLLLGVRASAMNMTAVIWMMDLWGKICFIYGFRDKILR